MSCTARRASHLFDSMMLACVASDAAPVVLHAMKVAAKTQQTGTMAMKLLNAEAE